MTRIFIFIGTYIAIGYVVGIPLTALLDYLSHTKFEKRGSTSFAIFGWPTVVTISLLLLPLSARDRLHAKLSRDDDQLK